MRYGWTVCCVGLAVALLGVTGSSPSIPGIFTASGKDGSVFGRGYDPVNARAKHAIFDLNYNNNKSAFNEYASPDLGGTLFSLPDEVYIANLPGQELTEDFSEFTNVSDYMKYQYEAHWSLIIAIIYNSASANIHSSLVRILNTTTDVLSVSQRITSSFKLDSYEPAVLGAMMAAGGSQYNSPFATELRLLPKTRTSDEDKQAYDTFIDKFGTHYVSSAVLGSQMDLVLGLDKTVAASLGVEFDANAKIALELLYIAMGLQVDIGGHTKEDLNLNFTKHAYMLIDVAGGDVAAIAAGDYASWLPSVAQNPAPANVTYTALSELVLDDTIAANLDAAAQQWLARINDTVAQSQVAICAQAPGVNLTMSQLPDPTSLPRGSSRVEAAPVPHPCVGVMSVGQGYDLLQGSDLAALHPPFTYDQQQQIYEPISKATYLVPDGFDLYLLASTCLRADQRTITTSEDVVEAWAGFTLDDWSLKIKHIKLKHLFAEIVAGIAISLNGFHSASFNVNFDLDLFRVTRGLNSPQDAQFVKDVAALPATQVGGEYDAFVSKWGTHLVESQDFGAHCDFSVAWDIKAMAMFTDEQKKDWSKWTISVLFAKLGIDLLHHVVESGNVTVNASFAAHINESFSCVGGSPAMLGTAKDPKPTWTQWLQSVRASPMPIPRGLKLRAMSEAVSSPDKRRLLMAAIEQAINNAPNASSIAQKPKRLPRQRTQATPTQRHGQMQSEDAVPNGAALLMVPGVCNGAGNVGVGCGVDATMMDLYGMNINPKKPVVKMPGCPRKCYLNPDNQDPECEDCTYSNPFKPDTMYRVPDNVFVGDTPMSGGCIEAETSSDIETYQEQVSKTTSHSSGFIVRHHHSKTVGEFYKMFYEEDKSLALMSEYVIWHSVTLMDAEPSWEFQLALDLLPLKYDKVKYRRFLQDFGTHYMSQTYMGGMVLMTNYYHSCFIAEETDTWVREQTTNSFIFIFNDGTISGHGTNQTDKTFEEWSEVTVKLCGGDAAKHGKLGRNNTVDPADMDAWKQSIKGAKMVPLSFKLEPITSLIKDDLKRNNVNQSIVEYVGEVAQINEDLQNMLEPKDPYIKPDWCHFSPKPPPHPNARVPKAGRANLGGLHDAPACPPLPPSFNDVDFGAFQQAQRRKQKHGRAPVQT